MWTVLSATSLASLGLEEDIETGGKDVSGWEGAYFFAFAEFVTVMIRNYLIPRVFRLECNFCHTFILKPLVNTLDIEFIKKGILLEGKWVNESWIYLI